MVDTNSLKAEIVRNGLFMQDVAKTLNISSRAMYSKMKTGNFTVKEAFAISEALNLQNPGEIFFAKKLS